MKVIIVLTVAVYLKCFLNDKYIKVVSAGKS